MKLFLLGIQTLVRSIEFSIGQLWLLKSLLHVKFEESNTLVKNVKAMGSLGEDNEKISLKDSSAQENEDKLKDNTIGEVQNVEVEPTQSLSKD